MRLPHQHMNAERRLPFGRIEDASDIAHRLRIGPRRAGDHRIGFAEFQHQRGKDIAILIDHAFAFTAQIAAPLQPLVQFIDHRGHKRRIAAVVDFESLRLVDAQRAQLLMHIIAANKDRDAVTAILERDRGAQDDFLFAFGKHDTTRLRTRTFIGKAEH